MPTEPLTGTVVPDLTFSGDVAAHIANSVRGLADNTRPDYATTGERDSAYAAWVAGGNTMRAGLRCTVGGRDQRYTGAAWEYVPTHRGAGTAFPTTPVEGDLYRHDTYRATMLYHSGQWRQAVVSTAASDADRTAWLAALVGAGLTMHGGFLLYQTDTDQLWAAESGTTLLAVGGRSGYGTRPIAQLQRTGMAISSNNDPDVWAVVTNWAAVITTPAITVAATGAITLNQDGWVAVNGYAYSDDTVAGRSGVALDVPAAAFPVSRIQDIRARAVNTGYSSAGVLRQWVAWSGRVKAGDVLRLYLNQDSTDNAQIDYNAYLSVEYDA
jgi:hypothetical protein